MKPVAVTRWLIAGCVLVLGACGGDASHSSITSTTTALTTSTTTSTTGSPTTTSPPVTVTTQPAVTVSVVGDSIAMLSHDELIAAFAEHGWIASVVANSSTTVESNRAQIRAAVADHPRVVVIELGTNDAGQIGNAFAHPTAADRRAALARTVANIDGALDDLAAVACLVWVDINDWTLAPFYDVRGTAPTINAALRAEAARRPLLHLAPYRQTFAPADPTAAAWLRANYDEHLLHPATAEARTRIVALIAATVHQSCGV